MISLPSKQPTLCVTVPVRKKRRISYLSSVAVEEEATPRPFIAPRCLLFQQSPPRLARQRLVLVAAATAAVAAEESTPPPSPVEEGNKATPLLFA